MIFFFSFWNSCSLEEGSLPRLEPNVEAAMRTVVMPDATSLVPPVATWSAIMRKMHTISSVIVADTIIVTIVDFVIPAKSTRSEIQIRDPGF